MSAKRIACPNCGHQNKPERRWCKNCKVRLATVYSEDDALAVSQELQKASKSPSLVIVVIAIMALCGLAALASSLNSDSSSRPDVGDDTEAWVMCKQFVEDALKAPSTAEFQNSYDSDITEVGDQRWRVIDQVDAENSFGAMLRSEYDCTVEYRGDDQWRLISLDIE